MNTKASSVDPAPLQIRIGTSGFSYPAWKGSFYPPKLPANRMLEVYAAQLPCVELNNTFYRMPQPSTLDGWKRAVPRHFRFALKAPRSITHMSGLDNCQDRLQRFTELAGRLESNLGPLLFQLPPNLPCHRDRLERCLDCLPEGIRAAFEFRHPSWQEDPGVEAAVRERGCCLVHTDTAEAPLARLPRSLPLCYLRLRCDTYSPERLQELAHSIVAAGATDCYVFCKHEVEAPRWAASLQSSAVKLSTHPDAPQNVTQRPE